MGLSETRLCVIEKNYLFARPLRRVWSMRRSVLLERRQQGGSTRQDLRVLDKGRQSPAAASSLLVCPLSFDTIQKLYLSYILSPFCIFHSDFCGGTRHSHGLDVVTFWVEADYCTDRAIVCVTRS